MMEYGKKILRIMAGLTIYAFGVYMMIHASIGIAPWDVLSMGIAAHTPLNFGLSMTMISIVVLGFDILLKEPVGIGMLCDAFYTGNASQVFQNLDPLPASNGLFMSVVYMACGMFVCCYGQYFYMSAGLTCGPRDSFTVGVGKHFRRVSIGLVQNTILIMVFAAGWALGGPVGIGTVMVVLLYGSVMNLVFRLVKFEPRDIEQENMAKTLQKLLRKGTASD